MCNLQTRRQLVRTLGGSLAHLALANIALGQKNPPTPRTNQTLEGWTVRVDDSLLDGPEAAVGRTALETLRSRLSDIARVVPADRLARLRTITIVLDRDHPLKSMQYHPSADWLRDKGYETSLARVVHLPHASELTNRFLVDQQPWAILHELAHAYHDQILSFDEPRILAAWNAVRKSGKLEKVLHLSGRTERHYALTDHKEFFAEFSESFFGTNDFFPFVRAELAREFPAVDRLLADVWGLSPSKPSSNAVSLLHSARSEGTHP